MSERERLIELVAKALDSRSERLPNGCYLETKERIADYLLANGVILAPCKVGDTVFVVEKDYCDKRAADKCNDYCDGWDAYCVNNLAEYVVIETKYSNSMIDLIGKSVFLTRDEAEAKLREINRRADND